MKGPKLSLLGWTVVAMLAVVIATIVVLIMLATKGTL